MGKAMEDKQFVKWVVILILSVIAAVATAIIVFVCLDYADEQPVQKQSQVVAIDENGDAVKDGQVMPQSMAFVTTSANIQTVAASVSVTAQISPSDAMYSSPVWSLAWKDSGVSGSVTDYVTVSQSSSNPLLATLTCKKAFSNKIELAFTVKDYYDKEFTKKCELNYLDHIEGIDYITARYLPGVDYSTYSPLPYNPYYNTNPCNADAFYYGSSSSVRYELGDIVLKWSGGTIKDTEEQISFSNLRLQYSVSYNNGWVSKTKEFSGDLTPYLDFCEIIESFSNKSAILSACNYSPLVSVMFTFTNWTSANKSFSMDFKLNYRTGISNVSLTRSTYTF